MRQISGKRAGPSVKLNDMNPAVLSAALGSLFPAGTVVAELRSPGNPELLLPTEGAHLGRAVPSRIQEFAAGRLCARRAMAQFGIAGFALLTADDRQPIWPPSVVGSITHTAGFCAAAVAERSKVRALGVDTERMGRVNAEIWPSICTPAEMAWIASLASPERAAAANLIFSAKEAFYKCQYPLTHEALNFHDARVEVPAFGASEGMFYIHPMRELAIAREVPLPLQGRYLCHEGFITAGLGLTAQ
jgi:enterobactin synthetase component D / holo-[acyl-carrier protein] synthase